MTILNAVVLDRDRGLFVADTASNQMPGNAPRLTSKLCAIPHIGAVAGARGPYLFAHQANAIAMAGWSFDDLVVTLPDRLRQIAENIQPALDALDVPSDQRSGGFFALMGVSRRADEMQIMTFDQASRFEARPAAHLVCPDPGEPVGDLRTFADLVELARNQVPLIRREGQRLGRDVAAGGQLVVAIVTRTELRLAVGYDFLTGEYYGPFRPSRPGSVLSVGRG